MRQLLEGKLSVPERIRIKSGRVSAFFAGRKSVIINRISELRGKKK